jgi:hypothetical protein
MDLYILEGRTPVKLTGGLKERMDVWGPWYATADRLVAMDRLPLATVSTVFLGLDHSLWSEEDRPMIFETMVFVSKALKDSPMDGLQRRCSTWAEAEAIHAEVMAELLKGHQEAAG